MREKGRMKEKGSSRGKGWHRDGVGDDVHDYRYSVSSSPMTLYLNEDHTHHLFTTHHHQPSSSSSSSSLLFNPDHQDQRGSSYWESKNLQQSDHEEVHTYMNIVCEKEENRSDVKLMRVWKKEEGCEDLEGEDSSVKWFPKLRMKMRRRIVSDQRGGSEIGSFSNSKQMKCEKKYPLSPLGTDDSNNSSSSNHSNITVRVCADCHTTKTPLWRGGPKGPKSLCNACGIRQRKARRALEAAASANVTLLVESEKSHVKKGYKLPSKGRKMSKTERAPRLIKKHKLEASKYRKGFGNIENFIISISENLARQQVFPQDEKEAAILLMALSYGLLHGFPSDRYLD
ncbi:hypothetical protein RJT34_14895 [Clitoria ternatea]|uniref:GATA-type domain-containing protein n=1 Tax=Clitoria ternatea TaxID=43366 RepID=A0AAN9JRQ0_CLITE